MLSKEPRLSISGWFHAAAPPDGAKESSSLAQLQRALVSSIAAPPPFRKLPSIPKGGGGGSGGGSAGGSGGGSGGVGCEENPTGLTVEEIECLAACVNPAYLDPRTQAALRAQLHAEHAVQLSSFLLPHLATPLAAAAEHADAKDAFGNGVLPPHTAGIHRKGVSDR